MNLQKRFLCFLISIFLNINIFTQMPDATKTPPLPSPEEIEKIMDSPEFKQMMDELDKIFGEEEEEETEKEEIKPKEAIKEIVPQITPEQKKQPEKVKSLEENFAQPAKSEKDSNDKIVKKLDSEKVKAFHYYIDQFVRLLGIVERKINSFDLGIAFKEEMDQLRINKSLNQINIFINFIKSKKLYLKVFYLPTFTELRKKILNTIKELKKIEPQISDPDLIEKSENSDFEYLKILANKDKKQKESKFNKLQKQIESLFKDELKEIEQKLSMVVKNSQINDEIKKKIEKRTQQQKDAERKKDSSKGWGSSSGYQPSYKSGYPSYPGYSSKSSRPSSYGSSGYPSSYSSPSYGSSRPLSPETSKKDRNLKDTGTTSTPSKGSDGKKKPKTIVPAKGDKLQTKLNSLKSLTDNSIKLISEIISKYADGNIEHIKDIYDSKNLSKLNQNLNEIEKVKKGINEKEFIMQDLNKKLDSSLTSFIPIAIPLAKNNGKQEAENAQKILNFQGEKINYHLKSYEEKIIKDLEKEKTNLDIFKNNYQEFDTISQKLRILNTAPIFSRKEIDNLNTVFSQTALNKLKNYPDLKELEAIEDGIGKADVKIKGEMTKFQTNKDVYNVIEDTKIKDYLKEQIKDIVIEPKQNALLLELTDDQRARIKEKFEVITADLEKKKRFLDKISKITNPEIKSKIEKKVKRNKYLQAGKSHPPVNTTYN